MQSADLVDIALEIYDLGAFKDVSRSEGGKGFKLKLHETNPDAPPSPVYLNLRTPNNPKPGPLTVGVVAAVAEQMHLMAIARSLNYDHVAGVPNAGDPLAAEYAEYSRSKHRPLHQIRLQKVQLEGKCHVAEVIDEPIPTSDTEATDRPQNRVLLIDDLITHADSKLEAIEALRASGLVVSDVVVIVDREQGGAAQLSERGYKLHSLFRITDLLALYVERGRITPSVSAEILDYLKTSN